MLKASKLFNQLFQKANEFAIQKNWSQAKSTFQEILSHESAQEMSPEFRLKVTIHLADCHIHLDSFNEAREILENRTIINRIYHLERGYEFLERKLKNCKAEIKRV